MIGENQLYDAYLKAHATSESLLSAYAKFPYAPVVSKARLEDAERHLKQLARLLGFDLVPANVIANLIDSEPARSGSLNCDSKGNVVGTR
jgi:phage terminase small subunit